MNPITVFQLASWTIGLWDYWLVGIEAGAGPIMVPLCWTSPCTDVYPAGTCIQILLTITALYESVQIILNLP